MRPVLEVIGVLIFAILVGLGWHQISPARILLANANGDGSSGVESVGAQEAVPVIEPEAVENAKVPERMQDKKFKVQKLVFGDPGIHFLFLYDENGDPTGYLITNKEGNVFPVVKVADK